MEDGGAEEIAVAVEGVVVRSGASSSASRQLRKKIGLGWLGHEWVEVARADARLPARFGDDFGDDLIASMDDRGNTLLGEFEVDRYRARLPLAPAVLGFGNYVVGSRMVFRFASSRVCPA